MNSLPSPARMASLPGDALVRLALRLDAIVTGANGAAYLAAATLLDGPLGMPASFLRWIGAFLLVFAAAVWLVSARREVSPLAVRAVIVLNAVWVIDSIALVGFGWHEPTTGGSVWVVLQAIVVAAFALLQAAALRRVVRM